uniref:DUF6570 domain-containing protein n=1 Tax=Amphimedon queenslandica TaxID=400682 RepID=A0A1X7VHC4_AMPQE
MSEAQGEALVDDQRLRSQQQCANELEAQREVRLSDTNESKLEREVRLLDLRQRDRERRDSETEEQRAQRNERMIQYAKQLSANQTCPAPSPESIRLHQLSQKDRKISKRNTTISDQQMLCMPLNSDGVVLVKPPQGTNATVSVPPGDQTASTSSRPESDRASTSTNSACANTTQSRTSTSTRTLFVVRKPLVVDALRWLKDNNTLYSDVNIDESVINDCYDSNNEPENSTSIDPPQFKCSVVRTDHTLPNLETIDFIPNGSYNNQVHQLP